MYPTLRHAAAEIRREAREVTTGLGREASARAQAIAGDGERAILSQAQAIRFSRAHRESLGAYRRLDGLLARFGAFDTGLDPPSGRPERFVAFIGYSRSGHSLVGSLLDAHPDAVIAHELHALKHIARGRSFDAVTRALRQNARIFQLTGRRYTGYDYVVPDQWQGTARRLAVVGDKKGNGSARLLRRDPDALRRILTRIPVPVHAVHVVRNPYDNIATKALRTGRGLEDAAEIYFANAAKIDELRARSDVAVHDLHLDDLIARPRVVLTELLGALALDPDVPGYLDACAEILFATPNRTRDRVAWPEPLVQRIERRLAGLAFTQRYAGMARPGA
jgi:hypothetical protein